MPLTPRQSQWTGRIGAALALASAGLHLVSLLGHAEHLALTVAILVMCAACLYCGYELWRAPTTRAWFIVGGMNAGMVLSHLAATTFWSDTKAQSPHAEHQIHAGHHIGGSLYNGGLEEALGIATVVAVLEVTLAAALVVQGHRMNRARCVHP
ncbi:hypothetical protein [Streptomyces sp. NPDC058206]|uniref:hypothetical protein n=1 Tax=Streptomyces sp. NPDC058206 TaxID=3346382 RepID=UPI0036E97A44